LFAWSEGSGTAFQLDPVQAAFSIGAMIRWLDFTTRGWRRSGDILQTIWAAFWLRRTGFRAQPLLRAGRTRHEAGIDGDDQAHEIQGCIALENSFNKVGLDHVVLVKVASTAW